MDGGKSFLAVCLDCNSKNREFSFLGRRDSTLKTSISVLIVDDQIVVRAGFTCVLRGYIGLSLAGAVPSGAEALIFLERCPVEVLLLDLRMPDMSGIETLRALQKLTCPPKAIILSSFEPDEEILRAVETGAQGYLRKDTSSSEIFEAIYAVHSGASYLPPWIVARVSERRLRSRLSPRELEILEMVAKGLTNKEIGRVTGVSPFTVRNHVRHIMAKLEAGDRTEAATVAIQEGILMPHHSAQRSGACDTSRTGPTTGPLPWVAASSGSRGGIIQNPVENRAILPKAIGAH
jgi:DNA-binding NarL/FixJ family response regulator